MGSRVFGFQLWRQKRNAFFTAILIFVVIIFFSSSLNLYKASVDNLQKTENIYRTIAIMELYGNINRQGGLVGCNDDDYIGYHTVGVDGYDYSSIVSANGVVNYDLREKSGVYISGHPAIDGSHDIPKLQYSSDIIRFTLHGDESVEIPIMPSNSYKEKIYIDIIDNALGDFYVYDNIDFQCNGIRLSTHREEDDIAFYEQQIKQLNRSNVVDTVILYPNVEYIAITSVGAGYRILGGSEGKLVAASRILKPGSLDYFGEDFQVYYYDRGEGITYSRFSDAESPQPFPIMRWEDLQSDAELKAQWEAAWTATVYNACAYTACFTNDITGIPLFHLGGTSLVAGRMITAEEYASGAKVCMVSEEMAKYQGWNVGDILDMNFFQYEAFPNNVDGTWSGLQPIYHKKTTGFYDSGAFEIVGIYTRQNIPGNSGISETTIAMAADTIYIPHNAVQNTLPEERLSVHGALLTIWLKNGSINDFLADMDALGLTERKEGQYNPTFTFYDQGYSVIQPSLQGMHSTAKLLLILAVLLLIITCVLLAYFFAQNQKHNIGIFRMLGGKKTQVLLAVFICSALITVVGAIPGAIIGHALSERVGETMLTGDIEENEKTAALRAYVLATEETDTSAFDIHSVFKLSLLAGSTALLFPILSLAFVVIYVGREPRELLPKNKA